MRRAARRPQRWIGQTGNKAPKKETPGERNLVLKHNRVSCNRRILRNVLMASALSTMLAAGGNIRPLPRMPAMGRRRPTESPAAARVLGVDGLAPVSLTVGSLAGRESRPIVF
jgi:hypothetical protein